MTNVSASCRRTISGFDLHRRESIRVSRGRDRDDVGDDVGLVASGHEPGGHAPRALLHRGATRSPRRAPLPTRRGPTPPPSPPVPWQPAHSRSKTISPRYTSPPETALAAASVGLEDLRLRKRERPCRDRTRRRGSASSRGASEPEPDGREVPEARRQPQHAQHRRQRQPRGRQRPAG